MEEKVAKMEEEMREKEEGESCISRRKKSSSMSSLCYYYSLQKPYEFLGAVGRAFLKYFRFHRTPDSAAGGGRGGGDNPTSAVDPVADSTTSTSTVTVVRSYATVIRARKPPTPPIKGGKPPQIH